MTYEFAYYITTIITVGGMLILINGSRRMFLRGKFSLLITIGTIMLFLAKIELLYSTWVSKPIAPLNIGGLILIFAIPTLWTVVSTVIFPLNDEDFLNLDSHYFRIKFLIFAIAAFNTILSSLYDTFYAGDPLLGSRNFWRVYIFSMFVFLAVEWLPESNRKKALHIFFWIVMIGFPFAYFLGVLSKTP